MQPRATVAATSRRPGKGSSGRDRAASARGASAAARSDVDARVNGRTDPRLSATATWVGQTRIFSNFPDRDGFQYRRQRFASDTGSILPDVERNPTGLPPTLELRACGSNLLAGGQRTSKLQPKTPPPFVLVRNKKKKKMGHTHPAPTFPSPEKKKEEKRQ